MSEEKTKEQIAAEVKAAKEAAAAQVKQAREEAKAAREAAKAQAQAARAEASTKAKAEREEAKAQAKVQKEAEKAAKAQARADAAKAKAEAKAVAAAAKVKVVQPSQNGITRPRAEGLCGKVWALADQLSAELGQPVPISILAPKAAEAKFNDATTRTQYARWKQFNGVFGVVPKPAAAAANASEAQAAA